MQVARAAAISRLPKPSSDFTGSSSPKDEKEEQAGDGQTKLSADFAQRSTKKASLSTGPKNRSTTKRTTCVPLMCGKHLHQDSEK